MRLMTEPLVELDFITPDALRVIERQARKSTRSEHINPHGDPALTERFVASLRSVRHNSCLEFADAIFHFETDIGISRELRTHRIASHLQESTRYCNYTKDKFGAGITVMIPPAIAADTAAKFMWLQAMDNAETAYALLIAKGVKPEDARSVLPLGLQCACAVKANFREWRHIIELRYIGLAGRPHPQIQLMIGKVAKILAEACPVVFGDLVKDGEP